MRITICGSMTFQDEMKELAKDLSGQFSVRLPEGGIKNPSAEDKRIYMQRHFEKIEWADIVLVYNKMKNGVDGYIGNNTLIEMGVAFYLKKKMVLASVIPDCEAKSEMEGMDLVPLNCHSLKDITPAVELCFLNLKPACYEDIPQ